MIDDLCQHYMALHPVVLWEMLIEDFFDLWVDFIIFKKREKKEEETPKVVPATTSIKNGGWC